MDAAPPPGGVLLTSPVLLRHTAGPSPAGLVAGAGSAGLAVGADFSPCALLIASAVLSPGRLSILGLATVGCAAGGVVVTGAGVPAGGLAATGGVVVTGAGVPAGGLAVAGAGLGNGSPGLFLTTAGTFTLGGIGGVAPAGVTTGGVVGAVGGFGVPLRPFIIALPALAT